MSDAWAYRIKHGMDGGGGGDVDRTSVTDAEEVGEGEQRARLVCMVVGGVVRDVQRATVERLLWNGL